MADIGPAIRILNTNINSSIEGLEANKFILQNNTGLILKN